MHSAFHLVFSNDDPVEQIIRLVSDINTKALTEEFKSDVLKLLNEEDDDYYYKKGVLRRK